MPKPQTAQSHAAMDPIYHYTLAPLLLVNLFSALYFTWRGWPHQRHLHLGWILISFALILLLLRLRTYSLKVQDRIIRLEEQIRLTRLAPGLDASQISTRQLIALRFASDPELPALAVRALAGNLEPRAIKQSIVSWRPDHHRV